MAFARESGWLALADELGFALLLPEQDHDNNRGRCFNWFHPDDVRRGGGEAMSIRQMLRFAVARYESDPKRLFIVGFSAGGGMAAAMLAAYPAVFAAGAVVAGMPVGCASNQLGAMRQMRRADTWRTREALAADVRRVTRARTRGVWPRISIWQGDRDRTIDPANAEVLAAQWSELHGHDAAPATDELMPGHRRRTWGREDQPPAVELWTLSDIGHGFPIDSDAASGGDVGPWVVDAGLSAARLIAAFCLSESGHAKASPRRPAEAPVARPAGGLADVGSRRQQPDQVSPRSG
jgi:poly(hydroxyalkanoate) depolymerase family esterase